MDYEILHDRIVRRLLHLVDRRGPGARENLREALDVGSSFFYDLDRQKARLPMDKINKILEILGIHPSEFFYEALREKHMRSLAPELDIDPAKLPQTVDPKVNEEVAAILEIIEDRMRKEEL